MGLKDILLNSVKAVAPTLVSFVPGIGPVASAGLKVILNGMKQDESETEEQVMERIAQNPALLAEVQKQAMLTEIEIEREKTKRLEAVNKTMQAEAISESKIQRSWRPFNGYMFGICLFCDYFVSQVVIALIFDKLPTGFIWGHVPSGVYMLWAAVLGVSVGSRGVEKVAKTKVQNGGQLDSILDTIKTFAGGAIGKK